MQPAATEKGYEILAIETDKDHIHFLIGYDCTDCVANIVKIVKQKTTCKCHNKNVEKKAFKKCII